jgi:hypothetical protein
MLLLVLCSLGIVILLLWILYGRRPLRPRLGKGFTPKSYQEAIIKDGYSRRDEFLACMTNCEELRQFQLPLDGEILICFHSATKARRKYAHANFVQSLILDFCGTRGLLLSVIFCGDLHILICRLLLMLLQPKEGPVNPGEYLESHSMADLMEKYGKPITHDMLGMK